MAEVSEALGVSDRTVRRYCQHGELRSRREGKPYFIDPASVREMQKKADKGVSDSERKGGDDGVVREDAAAGDGTGSDSADNSKETASDMERVAVRQDADKERAESDTLILAEIAALRQRLEDIGKRYADDEELYWAAIVQQKERMEALEKSVENVRDLQLWNRGNVSERMDKLERAIASEQQLLRSLIKYLGLRVVPAEEGTGSRSDDAAQPESESEARGKIAPQLGRFKRLWGWMKGCGDRFLRRVESWVEAFGDKVEQLLKRVWRWMGRVFGS